MPHTVLLLGWAQSIHVQRWALGLQSRSHSIKLISLGGKPIPGIETLAFPYGSSLAYLLRATQVGRVARAMRPDIVHAHYAAGFGLWGLATKHRPLVVSVWGSDLEHRGKSPLGRWLLHRVLRKADRVTTSSEYLKSRCLEFMPALESRLQVIPFGVELPNQVPLMPDDGPLRVLFNKGYHARYGPDMLVEAAAILKGRGVSLSVTMVGAGAMKPRVAHLVRQLGLADSVVVRDLVPHAEIANLLASHHVLAMPSRHEGFGVAALEAAAAGRPVVATSIGGIPEVVIHGQTGLLVPPDNAAALADALATLARDRRMCRQLGEAGRAFVEAHYTWARSLDLMTALYDDLFVNA